MDQERAALTEETIVEALARALVTDLLEQCRPEENARPAWQGETARGVEDDERQFTPVRST